MRLVAKLLVAWVAVAGCRSSKPSGSEPASGVASREPARTLGAPSGVGRGPFPRAPETPASPSAEPPTAPLTGEPLQALSVEGFGDAVVSVPLGSIAPRPIVVAMHGNYDRPEWQCEVWREVTRGFPWVLCPRGIPRDDAPKSADRWTFGGLPRFEKELFAGLAALAAAHHGYVDAERPIFTGFSLGAILGVHLLKRHDSPFERAVLIEGGYKGWGVAGARAFAERGGRKLLFGCGQTACVHAGKQIERLFAQHPIGVEVVSGGNVGHTYAAEVQTAVVERWAWLVEGDARYSPAGSPAAP